MSWSWELQFFFSPICFDGLFYSDFFKDFRQLLDDSLPLLLRLKDSVVDWVQEGFQDFFRTLYDRFLLLAGKSNFTSQDQSFPEGMQGDKTVAGLVLVLAQLSVFIEQSAIPRITEARITEHLIFNLL